MDKFVYILHASQLYTRNAFNKFKDEWSQVNRYKIEESECDAEFLKYLVRTKFGEFEEFMVKFNLQTYEDTCDCKKIEFVGILYRHMLKTVFVCLDIDKLPNHFILPRWKQEANKFRKIDLRDFFKNDGKEELKALRLSHICHQATKLGCVAASSNKAYFIYMDGINELAKKLSDISNQPATVWQQKDDLALVSVHLNHYFWIQIFHKPRVGRKMLTTLAKSKVVLSWLLERKIRSAIYAVNLDMISVFVL